MVFVNDTCFYFVLFVGILGLHHIDIDGTRGDVMAEYSKGTYTKICYVIL